jgi:hypothetical protein
VNEVLARGDSCAEAVEAERQLGRYGTAEKIIEHNNWMLDYLESSRRSTPCPIISALSPAAKAAIRGRPTSYPKQQTDKRAYGLPCYAPGKFPVPSGREFRHKPLDLLADWMPKIRL